MKYLFILLTILIFASCKTTKLELEDKSEVNKQTQGSNVEKVEKSQNDICEDVLSFEEGTTTTIANHEVTFGEGGGTFNANTGEATNVANVKTTTSTNENKKTETQTTKTDKSITDYTAQFNDSTTNLHQKNDIEKVEKSEVKSGGVYWLLGGIIIAVVAIIAIRIFL